MSHGSTKDFHWEGYKLYRGTKDTGFYVKPSEEDLWVFIWPDGVETADWYNLTRAKENAVITARRWFENESNSGEGDGDSPSVRLNEVSATLLAPNP